MPPRPRQFIRFPRLRPLPPLCHLGSVRKFKKYKLYINYFNLNYIYTHPYARTHASMHERTDAHTHPRTQARTHARKHAHTLARKHILIYINLLFLYSSSFSTLSSEFSSTIFGSSVRFFARFAFTILSRASIWDFNCLICFSSLVAGLISSISSTVSWDVVGLL